MNETCKELTGDQWSFRPCGKPAKGRGDVIGEKDAPLCGVHLAAVTRRAKNAERRGAEYVARNQAAMRADAIAAAEREVIAAAAAFVSARYSAIGLNPDKHDMALFNAVAALRRAREGK